MIPLWAQSGGLDEYMARLKDVDVREKIRKEVSKGIGGLAPLWQKVIMSSAKKDKNKGLIGMSIEDISKKRKTDPAETVLQLVEEEKGAVPVTVHNRVESDIRCFMDHPLAMFGSDGNAVSPEGFYRSGQPHPRFYGTYPRVLGRYVREKPSVLSLEDAIYKMTGFPAKRLGMKNRGQIKKDYIADLTIFDPKVVVDNATFEEPHQLPSGIPFVFVAGVIIIDNGKHSRKKPGKVLRRGTE
jgi:N-acyl-D-amino-acid deacylase